MRLDTDHGLTTVALVSFAIAAVLSCIAVYNYVVGVHGGAIVSAVGTVIASLLGLLSE